ncbi:MAG: hypothetical protein JWR69_2873 [Pedosphaera sp.]|nr:hypothetical protein [Pedosphaera sp.]
MPATTPIPGVEADPSTAARQRLLASFGEPFFYSDWLRVVFIHYEIDPARLQPFIPFPLDLRDGKAYVSLVAFTMEDLRPRWGGALTALAFARIATHELLNVRTYVRHGDEPGIYFIAEWIPNRLSVWIGPRTFGLPYRHGRLEYKHLPVQGNLSGRITGGSTGLAYDAIIDPHTALQNCSPGSLDEFLIERYTAFTSCGSRKRFFRIWHPPWLQTEIDVHISNNSLLSSSFTWFGSARFAGAHFAPGVERVWMGRPYGIAG